MAPLRNRRELIDRVSAADRSSSHTHGADSPPQIRRIILEQSKRAHVGHIGSALSVVDIIATLYGRVMRLSDPSDPDRDRFILSKGHAALAQYAALHLRGWIDEDTLNSFCTDASLLGVHPEHPLTGVDYSTGSLGHGLPMGAGAALAARLSDSTRRIFVLVSDAECNEGSLWEAVMFAAHHRLSNLIVIVDANAQQALGYTRDVLDLSPLEERWRAFSWDASSIDGHDVNAMETAIDGLDTASESPHVLVARTTFGKGVSFMERQIMWHYLPLSDEQYEQALIEIGSPQ
jgi:transketolase